MASVYLSLLFAVLALSHPTLSLNYSDCGSASGTVTDVEVKGCETGDTCVLKKGTKAEITIKFDSKVDTSSLTAVVHGIIHMVPLPFPLPQPDACKDSGIACPLKNSQSYVYNNELDVKSSYPSVDVSIKWELRDQNGADVVCITIPSKLE